MTVTLKFNFFNRYAADEFLGQLSDGFGEGFVDIKPTKDGETFATATEFDITPIDELDYTDDSWLENNNDLYEYDEYDETIDLDQYRPLLERMIDESGSIAAVTIDLNANEDVKLDTLLTMDFVTYDRRRDEYSITDLGRQAAMGTMFKDEEK